MEWFGSSITIYTKEYLLIILYPLQEGAIAMLKKIFHSSAYHATIVLADLLRAPHLL